MATNRGPAGSPSPKAQPVEIFSVQPGQGAYYRFLGDLLGLNTHWTGKRTVPCDGEGTCQQALHRLRLIFKAYAPVEKWVPANQHWLPGVLEATEHLEEQLRSRQLRGEVWNLSRGKTGGKSDPVVGVYSETFNEERLRPAFDILPVLLRFYHVPTLVLGVQNRLTPKVLLEPTHGDQPKLPFCLEPDAPPMPDEKELKRMREEVGSMRQRFNDTAKQPNHTSNGKD